MNSVFATKPARLIVCETTHRWSMVFRWALADDGPRLSTVADGPACRRLLAGAPASLVAWEVSPARAEAVARELPDCRRDFPYSRHVLLADAATREAAWQLRQLGADYLVESAREVPPLAGLVRRHWQQVPALSGTLETRIWARMPWADVAKSTPPVELAWPG